LDHTTGAVPGTLDRMLEILITQRAALENMLVTVRDIDQEPLSAGIRLTVRIYTQILQDGLSVLGSLISYLETKRYMDIDSER
jgi:hypothetical protein